MLKTWKTERYAYILIYMHIPLTELYNYFTVKDIGDILARSRENIRFNSCQRGTGWLGVRKM